MVSGIIIALSGDRWNYTCNEHSIIIVLLSHCVVHLSLMYYKKKSGIIKF